MIRPPALRKGDKIALVSPARSITFGEVHPAIRFFAKHDLEVVLGHNVFATHRQFAGTDEQRLRDLQQALDDDSIRAVVCTRGGYGTLRIVDRVDFTAFCRNPKWVAGYSDVTVLHAHIQQCHGIETIHSAMPVGMTGEYREESFQTLISALFGKRISYTLPAHPLSRPGTAEGELTGGNLSILYSLAGSVSMPATAGKILFLEDVDEYLYHIDRIITALKRTGALAGLAGLIVGGMTRMNDNTVPFGMSAEEIIADAVKEYGYPVCFGFPAGHMEPNLALILGRKARFTVGAQAELSFF